MLGVRVLSGSRYFLSQILRHVPKNIHFWVENEYCSLCTANISKFNCTNRNIYTVRVSVSKYGPQMPRPGSLTHWGRDKIDAILQTTFSNAISWMKMLESRLKLHWSLFLSVQLTIFQHWFRYCLGADQATSYYLKQWWSIYWRIYMYALTIRHESEGWGFKSSSGRDIFLSWIPRHIVNNIHLWVKNEFCCPCKQKSNSTMRIMFSTRGTLQLTYATRDTCI